MLYNDLSTSKPTVPVPQFCVVHILCSPIKSTSVMSNPSLND